MNAIQFIKEHGVEKAREVFEGAPETATHFTEALGGHYAKEGMLKMKPQWLWFNSINKEWCYDFAAEDHIHLPDLKRLVESVDLIEKHHSIDHAKNHYNNMREALNQYQYENKDIEDLSNKLKQAIADYEAIGGEHV